MQPIGSDTADFSNVTELFPAHGKVRSIDFDEAFYGRDQNVWLNKVRRKLADLTALQENWDTYGANPVAPDTVLFGFQVLSEIWSDGLSDPDISPMSNEGIMFEWISENCEFIIELEGPYKIRYFFDSGDGDEAIEDEVSQNFSPLRALAKEFVRLGQAQQQIA